MVVWPRRIYRRRACDLLVGMSVGFTQEAGIGPVLQ
jgi:hypothetical protein